MSKEKLWLLWTSYMQERMRSSTKRLRCYAKIEAVGRDSNMVKTITGLVDSILDVGNLDLCMDYGQNNGLVVEKNGKLKAVR